MNENVPWGCRFRRGDACRIPIQGGYYLKSSGEGKLVFAAFENGSRAPATKVEFPVTRGSAPFTLKLPYTIGKTAKSVNFQGFLETKDGKVLFAGKPHVFPVEG